MEALQPSDVQRHRAGEGVVGSLELNEVGSVYKGRWEMTMEEILHQGEHLEVRKLVECILMYSPRELVDVHGEDDQ